MTTRRIPGELRLVDEAHPGAQTSRAPMFADTDTYAPNPSFGPPIPKVVVDRIMADVMSRGVGTLKHVPHAEIWPDSGEPQAITGGPEDGFDDLELRMFALEQAVRCMPLNWPSGDIIARAKLFETYLKSG